LNFFFLKLHCVYFEPKVLWLLWYRVLLLFHEFLDCLSAVWTVPIVLLLFSCFFSCRVLCKICLFSHHFDQSIVVGRLSSSSMSLSLSCFFFFFFSLYRASKSLSFFLICLHAQRNIHLTFANHHHLPTPTCKKKKTPSPDHSPPHHQRISSTISLYHNHHSWSHFTYTQHHILRDFVL
jgi:hypothetical protein